MRKVIAAINMTLDGFCDHTSMVADDELHQHYNDLLSEADTILYGRITYELMENYWPTVVESPTGNKPTDQFAVIIDKLNKVVFSRTLKKVGWKNARLATKSLEEEVIELSQQPGNDILVGSRSLIVALLNLNLVDEFQLCVHPVIAGAGLRLFNDITGRINLELSGTKTINSSGSIVLYYKPLITDGTKT